MGRVSAGGSPALSKQKEPRGNRTEHLRKLIVTKRLQRTGQARAVQDAILESEVQIQAMSNALQFIFRAVGKHGF